MSAVTSLEKSLDDVFVKSAPALPAGGKKFLVDIVPWASLFFGVVSVYYVYVIWHWAHAVNSLVNYANTLSAAYGGPQVATADRLGVGLWIGLVVLTVEAILYLMAFAPTKARKKSGWDLLFYALIVNVIYGVVIMFTSYGGAGNLVGSVIGTVIGLYFLFQIRASYTGAKAPAGDKKA